MASKLTWERKASTPQNLAWPVPKKQGPAKTSDGDMEWAKIFIFCWEIYF